MFQPYERRDLEELLLSLLAADTIWYNMRKHETGEAFWKGSVETSPHLIMLKPRLDHVKGKVTRHYEALEKEMGDAFPIPDWRERIEKHHQAQHLLELYGKDGKKLRGMKKKKQLLASVHANTRQARINRLKKQKGGGRKKGGLPAAPPRPAAAPKPVARPDGLNSESSKRV